MCNRWHSSGRFSNGDECKSLEKSRYRSVGRTRSTRWLNGCGRIVFSGCLWSEMWHLVEGAIVVVVVGGNARREAFGWVGRVGNAWLGWAWRVRACEWLWLWYLVFAHSQRQFRRDSPRSNLGNRERYMYFLPAGGLIDGSAFSSISPVLCWQGHIHKPSLTLRCYPDVPPHRLSAAGYGMGLQRCLLQF